MSSMIDKLLALTTENEVVEFKEAKSQYDKDKLGQYFSALSNEANLKGLENAWMVLGVKNNKTIVGTTINDDQLNDYKNEMAQHTSPRLSFDTTTRIERDGKQVILLKIPAAPQGQPVSWKGHCYGRDGESLGALHDNERDRIKIQNTALDWSAQIVPDATIEDLDKDAIAKARIEFVKRNPKYKEEEPKWSDTKFLDKARLTIKGKITRTALILVGNEEAEHFLGSTVKVRWNLKTVNNQDKAFEVFSIPLLLAVDEVFKSIRNLKYVYLRDGTLFPDEFLRYEPFNIREPLNNAIAHQDYTKKAYINVVEFEDDHLVFSNYGLFLPKSVEEVVLRDAPEEQYRNPFLVAAMKNLDMIETQGGGIRKLFNFQRQRFFPMPDYDFSDGKCKVTITGKIVNEDFARILIKNPSLSLVDILLLDKVQKKRDITEDEYNYLKKFSFIEGRKNSPYLSYNVIEPTNDPQLKADYIKNRGLDDAFVKKYLYDYIKLGRVQRKDIERFIWEKLSDVLDENKKKNKVKNLLQELRKEGKIQSPDYGYWEIV